MTGICLADNAKRSAEPEPQPNPNVDVTVNEEGELEDYYDDGNRLVICTLSWHIDFNNVGWKILLFISGHRKTLCGRKQILRYMP